MMGVYLALVGVTFGLFKAVPGGFVPAQDKQYLVGFAQLPDGATLDRTEDVIRRMSDIALKSRASSSAVAFPGLSINGFTNSAERRHRVRDAEAVRGAQDPRALSGGAIAKQLNQKFAAIQDAFIAMFPPPPVQGLGTIGGFKLQIEDRAGLGYEALDDATKAFMAKAAQGAGAGRRVLRASRSTCRSSTPTSTAPRRASSASPSPTCSTRCRSISARST